MENRNCIPPIRLICKCRIKILFGVFPVPYYFAQFNLQNTKNARNGIFYSTTKNRKLSNLLVLETWNRRTR